MVGTLNQNVNLLWSRVADFTNLEYNNIIGFNGVESLEKGVIRREFMRDNLTSSDTKSWLLTSEVYLTRGLALRCCRYQGPISVLRTIEKISVGSMFVCKVTQHVPTLYLV